MTIEVSFIQLIQKGGGDLRLRRRDIGYLLANLADELITVYAFLLGILIKYRLQLLMCVSRVATQVVDVLLLITGVTHNNLAIRHR